MEWTLNGQVEYINMTIGKGVKVKQGNITLSGANKLFTSNSQSISFYGRVEGEKGLSSTGFNLAYNKQINGKNYIAVNINGNESLLMENDFSIHHFAFVWDKDSTLFEAYIDSNKKLSNIVAIFASGDDLIVEADDNGKSLNIDHLRLFNGVIDSSMVNVLNDEKNHCSVSSNTVECHKPNIDDSSILVKLPFDDIVSGGCDNDNTVFKDTDYSLDRNGCSNVSGCNFINGKIKSNWGFAGAGNQGWTNGWPYMTISGDFTVPYTISFNLFFSSNIKVTGDSEEKIPIIMNEGSNVIFAIPNPNFTPSSTTGTLDNQDITINPSDFQDSFRQFTIQYDAGEVRLYLDDDLIASVSGSHSYSSFDLTNIAGIGKDNFYIANGIKTPSQMRIAEYSMEGNFGFCYISNANRISIFGDDAENYGGVELPSSSGTDIIWHFKTNQKDTNYKVAVGNGEGGGWDEKGDLVVIERNLDYVKFKINNFTGNDYANGDYIFLIYN